jgi:hypothetical protein
MPFGAPGSTHERRMWNQIVIIVIGLWLMASPDVMEYSGPERTNHHILGPLVVSFGVIALSETTRSVRWANAAVGLWLIAAPFALSYNPLKSSLLGVAIFALSLIEGSRREQLGGGWTRLWKTPPTTEASGGDTGASERAP